MVVIRSALENGKQEENPRINQNYGYGAIYENVPKLFILRKMRKFCLAKWQSPPGYKP